MFGDWRSAGDVRPYPRAGGGRLWWARACADALCICALLCCALLPAECSAVWRRSALTEVFSAIAFIAAVVSAMRMHLSVCQLRAREHVFVLELVNVSPFSFVPWWREMPSLWTCLRQVSVAFAVSHNSFSLNSGPFFRDDRFIVDEHRCCQTAPIFASMKSRSSPRCIRGSWSVTNNMSVCLSVSLSLCFFFCFSVSLCVSVSLC